MPTARYRVKSPFLALFLDDERGLARVPTGSIIMADDADFFGEQLAKVTLDGKAAMVPAQDLRVRAERVAGTSE
jgi:hypothetical protein